MLEHSSRSGAVRHPMITMLDLLMELKGARCVAFITKESIVVQNSDISVYFEHL